MRAKVGGTLLATILILFLKDFAAGLKPRFNFRGQNLKFVIFSVS